MTIRHQLHDLYSNPWQCNNRYIKSRGKTISLNNFKKPNVM